MIAGRKRVSSRVVKVASPIGSGTYYDMPEVPGFERRQLFISYLELREAMDEGRLSDLAEEYRSADRQAEKGAHAAARAIGAVRRVQVVRQVLEIEKLLNGLHERSAVLSRTISDRLDQKRSRLHDMLDLLGDPEEIEEDAEAAIKPFDLSLEVLLTAERPLMTSHDYAEYLPVAVQTALTPPEILNRVIALRRFENPKHISNTHHDPDHSARQVLDRVEALCYLAERYQGAVFSFLADGRRLLGRNFRSPELLEILVDCEYVRLRRTALAALVPIAPDVAVAKALEWLAEDRSAGEVEDALYALLVCRQVDPSQWPERIRRASDPSLRDIRTKIIFAARSGRWLLQRQMENRSVHVVDRARLRLRLPPPHQRS